MRNDYAVFQLRIALELCKMGFTLVNVVQDRNNPKYNVFFFQKEEGLEEAIKKLATKH